MIRRIMLLHFRQSSTEPVIGSLIITIQFFIIYVPSQQLQGQLQTQSSADIHKHIMDRLNIE
jgi:hypothetical protein